jgi:hypothetical protein
MSNPTIQISENENVIETSRLVGYNETNDQNFDIRSFMDLLCDFLRNNSPNSKTMKYILMILKVNAKQYAPYVNCMELKKLLAKIKNMAEQMIEICNVRTLMRLYNDVYGAKYVVETKLDNVQELSEEEIKYMLSIYKQEVSKKTETKQNLPKFRPGDIVEAKNSKNKWSLATIKAMLQYKNNVYYVIHYANTGNMFETVVSEKMYQIRQLKNGRRTYFTQFYNTPPDTDVDVNVSATALNDTLNGLLTIPEADHDSDTD